MGVLMVQRQREGKVQSQARQQLQQQQLPKAPAASGVPPWQPQPQLLQQSQATAARATAAPPS
jgi:hypothetical protein